MAQTSNQQKAQVAQAHYDIIRGLIFSFLSLHLVFYYGHSCVDCVSGLLGCNNRVQVFDSNGTFLRSFGRFGQNAEEFNNPNGIAINKDRNIFVADKGNERAQIFSWEGRHLGSFGHKGILERQFLSPRGLSLDITGNAIVADAGNKLIKIFTPDGRFVMKIGRQGSFSCNMSCVQCGEYFIVSDYSEPCIKVFNREGHFQYKFGKKGEGDGEFNCP